jgi:hypothetical protein
MLTILQDTDVVIMLTLTMYNTNKENYSTLLLYTIQYAVQIFEAMIIALNDNNLNLSHLGLAKRIIKTSQ